MASLETENSRLREALAAADRLHLTDAQGLADILAAVMAADCRETRVGLAELLASQQELESSRAESKLGQANLLASERARALAMLRAHAHLGVDDLLASNVALASSQAETRVSLADLLTSEIALASSRAETKVGLADLLASETALASSRAEIKVGLADLLASEVALASSREDTRTGLADLLVSEAALASSREDTKTGLADLLASEAALASSRADTQVGRADLMTSERALASSQAETRVGLADLLASTVALASSRADTKVGLADLLASAVALASSRADTKVGLADLLASQLALASSRADTKVGLADLLASEAALALSQAEAKVGVANLLASEVANKAVSLANARLVTSETAMRENDERIRFANQAGRMGFWEVDLRGNELTANDMCKEHFGWDQRAGFSYADLQDAVHSDDRAGLSAAIQLSVASGAEFNVECRVVRSSGATGWVQVKGHAARAADGIPLKVAGISLDITERVLAQERIRQSQRIEAIGRLTAGLAGDFNNVLQAMLGGIELAIEEVADRPDVCAGLKLALGIGHRGARLTSHLLSFSRQQTLLPAALEIAPLLRDLSRQLTLTLGRGVTICIAVASNLPRVFADAAHLESALLNLALNARDAMPRGGELRVEARAVDNTIIITVTDNGEGMAPDVLARACEPFFTTKGLAGSGLGLSMVHGFARQSGGDLRIQSVLGKGTRIEIILPVAAPTAAAAPKTLALPAPASSPVLALSDHSAG